MATIDLSQNNKQETFFNTVLESIMGINQYKYFAYGGAIRGGKSFVTGALLLFLCNKYPRSRWHIIRQDIPVLEATTIPTMEKLIAGSNKWKWIRDRSNYRLIHKNGAQIFFKGENITRDPDLNDFLGLETNGIWLEQAEELSEKMWQKSLERTGSWYIDPMPPSFIFTTFNPTQTWVKKKFYEPYINGELKEPFYFQSALPKDNPFVTESQWQNWENMHEKFRLQFIQGDWTDFADGDNRWAFAFEPEKHVGKCEINPLHEIWLSFDFNRNPITCLLVQHYDNCIYVPRAVKLQNSNIYALCEHLRAILPPNALLMITGDATGKGTTALVQDNINYYTVIMQMLNISVGQLRVPTVNPKIEENQVLVNSLLSNYRWCIDKDNAEGLIYDLKYVKVMPDGKIDKGSREDPTKQADILDCMRYFCNTEMKWFLQFNH